MASTPPPAVKPSLVPTTKVTASAVTGAVVVILVWVVGRFAGVEVPPEVAAAAAVVLSFGSAYVVKDRS